MTTEDDFQDALDATPEDWQLRMVFADWLEEQGDPRAVGYRALGALRLCPYYERKDPLCWWTTLDIKCVPKRGVHGAGCSLPEDWYAAIKGLGTDDRFKPCDPKIKTCSRRAAEDAAARAFATLRAKRRATLLKRA
jgi:uncharacterized protein (TIGR02996 family)